MGFVENVNKVAQGLSAEFIAGVLAITNNPTIVGGSLTGNIFLTNGLPTTANIGDIAVNTIDGGIYQYLITAPATTPAWLLVAQSAGIGGGGGTATATVGLVSGLPATYTANGIVYNTVDGIYYAFVGGAWQAMVAPTLPATTVGIEVVASLPTTGLVEGRVVFNQATNMLMKYTTGAWVQVVEPTGAAAAVADGTLTVAKFAAGLAIIEIVATLPTAGNYAGRIVYLTTDGQLYRSNGTVWSNSVPTTALTGTITSTQIGANQITTGALAVGAVTADTIAANAITAGKIATNAITAGTIQAGAIGANEIAAGAITATKIAAGAVTANSIAALSIDATKIVAGSIGASHIAANSITSGMIQAGAIQAVNLAADSVTATQIAAGSITTSELAPSCISGVNIQGGVITANKIVAGDIAVVTHIGAVGFLNTVTAFGSGLTYTNTEQMLSIIVPNANTVPLKILVSVQGRTGFAGTDGSFNMALFNGTINVGEYGWSPSSQDARCGQTSFTIAANSSATISIRGCKSNAATTQSYTMNMAIYGARN